MEFRPYTSRSAQASAQHLSQIPQFQANIVATPSIHELIQTHHRAHRRLNPWEREPLHLHALDHSGRLGSRPPLPMQPHHPTARRLAGPPRKTSAARARARPGVLVRKGASDANTKGGQGSNSGGSAPFSTQGRGRTTRGRPSSSAAASPGMVRPYPRPTCAFCNTCQLCRADPQATCDLCRQCVLCTPAN